MRKGTLGSRDGLHKDLGGRALVVIMEMVVDLKGKVVWV